MKEKNNRTRLLHVRLTDAEFEKIESLFSKSTCQNISEFIRLVLQNKPVKILHRNESLDECISLLIALKDELNSIGVNHNQVVKKLHALQHCKEVAQWLSSHEDNLQNLIRQITEIKSRIYQINDKWLQ